MCDRVIGLLHGKVSDQLCCSANLLVDEVLFLARQHEDAEKDKAFVLAASASKVASIDATGKKPASTSCVATKHNRHEQTCCQCGCEHHSQRDYLAHDAICSFCHKQGHLVTSAEPRHVVRKRSSIPLNSTLWRSNMHVKSTSPLTTAKQNSRLTLVLR